MATQKIKKVETPIDQRETFVSLSKSFGESEMSVEEKLNVLYELQKADTEIDKIHQLRGDLPSEVAALEADIADVNAKIAAATDLIASFGESIEAKTQEIVDVDAEIERYQKLLDNIANSREYDSLNKEVENQQLLRQIAEKNIREMKEVIAAKKELIERLKDTLALHEDDLLAKQEELAGIVESTASEEGQLVARRDACAAKIDERTMSAYNRIRESAHNHLAVVTVVYESAEQGACGGCFTGVTAQRLIEIESGKKLVICEHCGRIIVASRKAEE